MFDYFSDYFNAENQPEGHETQDETKDDNDDIDSKTEPNKDEHPTSSIDLQSGSVHSESSQNGDVEDGSLKGQKSLPHLSSIKQSSSSDELATRSTADELRNESSRSLLEPNPTIIETPAEETVVESPLNYFWNVGHDRSSYRQIDAEVNFYQNNRVDTAWSPQDTSGASTPAKQPPPVLTIAAALPNLFGISESPSEATPTETPSEVASTPAEGTETPSGPYGTDGAGFLSSWWGGGETSDARRPSQRSVLLSVVSGQSSSAEHSPPASRQSSLLTPPEEVEDELPPSDTHTTSFLALIEDLVAQQGIALGKEWFERLKGGQQEKKKKKKKSKVDVMSIREDIRQRDEFLQQQTAQHFEVVARRVTMTIQSAKTAGGAAGSEIEDKWFQDRHLRYLAAKSQPVSPIESSDTLTHTHDPFASPFGLESQRASSMADDRSTAFKMSIEAIQRGITPFDENNDLGKKNLEIEKKAFYSLTPDPLGAGIEVPSILPADVLLTLSLKNVNKVLAGQASLSPEEQSSSRRSSLNPSSPLNPYERIPLEQSKQDKTRKESSSEVVSDPISSQPNREQEEAESVNRKTSSEVKDSQQVKVDPLVKKTSNDSVKTDPMQSKDDKKDSEQVKNHQLLKKTSNDSVKIIKDESNEKVHVSSSKSNRTISSPRSTQIESDAKSEEPNPTSLSSDSGDTLNDASSNSSNQTKLDDGLKSSNSSKTSSPSVELKRFSTEELLSPFSGKCPD